MSDPKPEPAYAAIKNGRVVARDSVPVQKIAKWLEGGHRVYQLTSDDEGNLQSREVQMKKVSPPRNVEHVQIVCGAEKIGDAELRIKDE